ncbi:MAG: N-acetylmuramoyl-L-alanine amidase, partial [Nevskia sp.]|nr:N-acetylmuramoyl-L-alanine amidase [Nevskia sp.]
GHALIEVVGNFEEVEPNQKQLDAVADLMAVLAAKYRVPLEKIAGHKDYSAQTVCPGTNLYRYLQNGYFREQVALRLAGRRQYRPAVFPPKSWGSTAGPIRDLRRPW